MSWLVEIIEETKKNKRHSVEWVKLKNSYFRGENGFEDLKKWASDNGLKVSIPDGFSAAARLGHEITFFIA